MVVVVNGQLQDTLLVRIGLAENLGSLVADAVHIPLADLDRFMRKADAALDVIDLWLFGVLEDDNVESMGVLDLERELRDENPVPFKHRDVIDLVLAQSIAAIGTDCRRNARARDHGVRFALNLVAGPNCELRASLRADAVFVSA